MTSIKLSKELDLLKPTMEELIIDLGYSQEQAKLFSEGYAAKVKTLPMMEKLLAIENMHDDCMTAGFNNAGIDEDEAMKKYLDKI